MTDHVVRLYALALAVLVFFVAWAAVAARPWATPAESTDPRLAELRQREERLARRQVQVQRELDRRFAAYRRKLAERRRLQAAIDAVSPGVPASPPASAPAAAPAAQAPAAPSVQVTSLPPVTSSESS